jgi:hypothetical protein
MLSGLLAFLFIPAHAHAHVHSLHYRPPWHDRVLTLFMLAVAIAAVLSVVPPLVRGSVRQRILAGLVAAFPVYVLVSFIIYLVALYSS